jgi:methylsterol monooxygenase
MHCAPRWSSQDKAPSQEMVWKCVKHVAINQLLVQLPMMLLFHPAATLLGMKFLHFPFPPWTAVVTQCLVFLVVEDAYQYFAHRFLHWGSLYKNIHKLHHEYSAPFGIAAEYAHPLETIILGLGFFIGPLGWVYATGDLHYVTVAAWLALRLVQTVDSHSGYDFPWSLHHFLPFWAGAEFHDFHHKAFKGNYASSFRWWDALCGTSTAFGEWKRRKLAPHASGIKEGLATAATAKKEL